MEKIELIRTLIAADRACDLLLIMEGESKFNDETSEGAPRDGQLARLWTAALYHLRFISEFGLDSTGCMKDGRWLTPFPTEFDLWLEAGSPGLSVTNIEKYLSENPIAG